MSDLLNDNVKTSPSIPFRFTRLYSTTLIIVAVLLTAGAAGKRFALPNARIMIHQPLAGMEGTSTEIQIHVKEFLKTKKRLNEILKRHTGKTLEQLEKDTDRDNFMASSEARDYGLIDGVLERMPEGMGRAKGE